MNPEDSLLSAAFLEEMLARFARDPRAVPTDWRDYLSANDGKGNGDAGGVRLLPTFARRAEPVTPTVDREARAGAPAMHSDEAAAALQQRVDRLVWQYRVHGHRAARLDPLGRERPFPAELDPLRNGLSEAELDAVVVGARGRHRRTVRELIERLRRTYCGSIGVEFMHIGDAEARDWLAERMESDSDKPPDAADPVADACVSLTDAEMFEEFLQRKYLGAKASRSRAPRA